MSARPPALLVGTIALAFLAGGAVAFSPAFVVAGVAMIFLFTVTTFSPAAGLACWVLFTAVTPYWLVLQVGTVLTPPAVLAIPVVLALLPRKRPEWSRFNRIDFLMLAFLALTLLSTRTGGDLAFAKDAVFVWALPFLVGRLALGHISQRQLGRIILSVGLLCAAWSVAEFLLHWHPFTDLQGPIDTLNHWSIIDDRGGYARSEAAFGHSIALGAFLVLASPWALRSRRPWLAFVALVAGVACTLSRGSLLGIGAVALMSVWTGRASKRMLFLVVVLAGVGAYYGRGLLFGAEGADAQSLEWSNEHRQDLWATGFHSVKMLGSRDVDFHSIDNAYLRVGAELGAIPLAVLVLLVAIPTVRVVLRRTQQPGEIAVVATGMLMLTVALLTQWQALAWMVAGAAVTMHMHAARQHLAIPEDIPPGSELAHEVTPALTLGRG